MALVEDHQGVNGEEARSVISEWNEEVLTKQNGLKSMFNPQFGFTFRSHNNPTNISDLYSSRVATC